MKAVLKAVPIPKVLIPKVPIKIPIPKTCAAYLKTSAQEDGPVKRTPQVHRSVLREICAHVEFAG